jgi:Arm DNA-binding domain
MGRGRGIHWLTDRQGRTLPVGQYCDGGKLYLIVEGPQSRHWSFIFWIKGKKKKMGLGSFYRGVSPLEARRRAEQAREDLAAGKDPRLARNERRGAMITFGEVADQVLAARGAASKRPQYEAE